MEKPALAEGGGGAVEMAIAEPTHGPEAVLKTGILGNFEPNYPSRSGPGIKDMIYVYIHLGILMPVDKK